MRRRGFFVLARQATDARDAFWKEKPFDRWRARLDLFMTAAFSPYVDGEQVELRRGELRASIAFLAERWGWTPRTCDRFMKRLVSDGAVERVAEVAIRDRGCSYSARRQGTVWRIVNYDEYQPPWLGLFLKLFERPDILRRVLDLVGADQDPEALLKIMEGGTGGGTRGGTGGATETHANKGLAAVAVEPAVKLEVEPTVNKRNRKKRRSKEEGEVEKKKTVRSRLPSPEGVLDTPEFREAWESRCRQRSQARKAYVPEQAKEVLRDLAELAEMRGIEFVVKRVRDGVKGGWKSLTWPDDFKNDPRQHSLFAPQDRDGRNGGGRQGGEL